VAVAAASGYSSDSIPSLESSICHGSSPKKKTKKKRPKRKKKKKILRLVLFFKMQLVKNFWGGRFLFLFIFNF